MEQQQPRGLRNHNPLNIRHNPANKWQGMSPVQDDTQFVHFNSDEWGLRAAFVILRNWFTEAKRHRKILRVRDIVSRWAPANDGNNIDAYVAQVCQRGFIQETEQLQFTNENTMCRLVYAMAFVECGKEVSFGLICNAYAMAKH